MKKKKLFSMIMGMSVFASSIVPTYALSKANGMKVVLDGSSIPFTKETGFPMMDNGRTYLPLRILSESMGIDVSYDSSTSAVFVRMEGMSIDLFNNNHMAVINAQWVPIDERDGKIIKETTVKIKDGRTYVPIRFVSEQLGVKVEYSNGNINLTSKSLGNLPLNEDFSAKKLLGFSEDNKALGQLTINTLKEFVGLDKNKSLEHLKIRFFDNNSLPMNIAKDINIVDFAKNNEELIVSLDKKVPSIYVNLFVDEQLTILSTLDYVTENEGKYSYKYNLKELYSKYPSMAPGKEEALSYIGIAIQNNSLSSINSTSNSTIYMNKVK